jgi:UDP-N-acetylglucosamine 2-epimerase (non-hydrolysing)
VGNSRSTPSDALLHVVGARPNFPKLAPVHRAGRERGIEQVVVHTGQHYDENMSASFFSSLGIPEPDISLEVGSGSHAVQTARIMERFEPVLEKVRPACVMVYGDVNSTLAASVVATKLGVRVAHVEAGLRSFDRRMPEEINRLVTDRLSDLLLAPSEDAVEQLRREGEPAEKIVLVGNVMIDTLMRMLPQAKNTGVLEMVNAARPIALVTLHRPSNVDDPGQLGRIVDALRTLAAEYTVVFPMHPRTRDRIAREGLDLAFATILDPIPYLWMLELMRAARIVVTDSGGVQEETTVLGVPCFTIRENTERPITISEGTNELVPDVRALPARVHARAIGAPDGRVPTGWDGRAASRVIDAIVERGWVSAAAQQTR